MIAAKNFLLIDDDNDDRELFTEALAAVEPVINCTLAMDGAEALLKLETRGIAEPDIIFLDINLPVMNGWQFLQKLKTYDGLKHIPVIMYSTSSEPSDRAIANSLGASCFLTKPHTYKHLKQLLQQIVIAAQQKNPAIAICKVISGFRPEN